MAKSWTYDRIGELLQSNLIQGQNSVIKLTKSFRPFHIANQERTISLLLECLIDVKDIST